jgi:hypothetical protein
MIAGLVHNVQNVRRRLDEFGQLVHLAEKISQSPTPDTTQFSQITERLIALKESMDIELDLACKIVKNQDTKFQK